MFNFRKKWSIRYFFTLILLGIIGSFANAKSVEIQVPIEKDNYAIRFNSKSNLWLTSIGLNRVDMTSLIFGVYDSPNRNQFTVSGSTLKKSGSGPQAFILNVSFKKSSLLWGVFARCERTSFAYKILPDSFKQFSQIYWTKQKPTVFEEDDGAIIFNVNIEESDLVWCQLT